MSAVDGTALLVIVVAVSAGAVTKAITGLGLPLIGVPVIATFLGVERAVLVMALPTFLTNLWLIWEYRAHYPETRHLRPMAALGVIGAVLGTIALTRVDPDWLALLLGGLILGYLLLNLVRPGFSLSAGVTLWASPVVGLAGGVLQGATGISGPVIATYLHSFRLSREGFVLSVTTMFQTFSLVQILTFATLGRYTRASLVQTGVALVPIALLFPAGLYLARHVDSRRFERLILVLLLVMGFKLLIDGLRR